MSPMLALYSWPVVSLVMLRVLRLPLAILLVIITGYMFLPSRFAIDFPMIPPIDKNVVPVLTVVVAVLLMSRRSTDAHRLPGFVPKSWFARALLLLVVLGPLGTVWANPDAIVTPLEVKRALVPYDGFAYASAAALLVLPLLLGRTFFARSEQHRLILVVLCVAACAYAFLALYEVRMSPRLNRIIYGFTSHSWLQHIRGDGFRPMVFMEHGLRVSLFFAMGLIATVGLWRLKWRPGVTLPAALWLTLTLILCKSLGALMIAVLIVPMVLFLNTRLMLLAAAVIAMAVLTYPVLRGAGLVPVDRVLALATNIDAYRAESFGVRLKNEDELLARANERALFGWGGFGREQLRDEKGRNVSIPDGYWVISIGQGGWTRYFGQFGLMALPILFLFLYRRRMDVGLETAILSILLAANMIDLIPNSGQTPITWLIAGALWGRIELRRSVAVVEENEMSDNAAPGTIRYARDFGTAPPPRRRPPGRKPVQRGS